MDAKDPNPDDAVSRQEIPSRPKRTRAKRIPEDPYLKYLKPDLGPRLKASGLLVDYHRGAGDRLYTLDAEGRELEVLDLVGGYGANLLGHAHPQLILAAQEVLAQGSPFHAQGARRDLAAQLAGLLGDTLHQSTKRDYVFVFSHSGSEAVNIALYHAHLEYQQKSKSSGAYSAEPPTVLMLEGSYHGTFTQAVAKRDFPGPKMMKVSASDLTQLEEVFDRERRPHGSRIMAMLVETIQGEGGVRPVPTEFLEAARRLCRRDGVPLVLDEVQTGLGRCGEILDSLQLGLTGDYVVLAKALSGGLTKLGITAIDRDRWVKDFDLYSLSTYSEEPLSAAVGKRVLELLLEDRGKILTQVRDRGEELMAVLDAVREEFPHVIREVRGRGLMIGVEFHSQSENASNAIRMVSESGLLGQFLSSYLLSREAIRIAPTVSADRVLRIEPSYAISRADMDRVAQAFRTLCDAVEKGDCGFLARGMLEAPSPEDLRARPVRYRRRVQVEEIPAGIPRVAFLGHFILPEHLSLWDPSFGSFSRDEKAAFLGRFAPFLDPRVFRSFVLESKTGARVGYTFIGLAQTSHMYAESWMERDVTWLREKISKALDLAREEGCQVVGFGGFTSIVTENLRSVDAPDLVLTTGNSYTVAAGVDALEDGARALEIPLEGATLGVVGALGNIASIYACIMIPRVARTLLIGRPQTRRRLERFVRDRVPAEFQDRVEIHTDLSEIGRCELVLGASSSPDALLFPHHFEAGRKLVVMDISIPADASESLEERPGTLILKGGLIKAWKNDQIRFPGIPLEGGQFYACMAETALLGLEGVEENFSEGAVLLENVDRIRRIAQKHGFEYLGPKLEASL